MTVDGTRHLMPAGVIAALTTIGVLLWSRRDPTEAAVLTTMAAVLIVAHVVRHRARRRLLHDRPGDRGPG